jgi:hypothetical protein
MKVRTKRDLSHKVRYSIHQLTIAEIRHQRYCRKAWFSLINEWSKHHLGDFYFPVERFKWLSKQNHQPSGRHALVLKFRDLHPSLSLYLDNHYQCMMMVNEQNQFWDVLWSSDILPMQSENGQWFDGFVSDHQTATTFSTLKALVETEMLQPLIDWINTQLSTKYWLGLYGTPNGSTWAKLEDDCELSHRFYLQQSDTQPLSVDESQNLYRLYPIKEFNHVSTRH